MRVDEFGNSDGARKLIGGSPFFCRGCIVDRPRSFVKGLCRSMPVGTRKMVNYA